MRIPIWFNRDVNNVSFIIQSCFAGNKLDASPSATARYKVPEARIEIDSAERKVETGGGSGWASPPEGGYLFASGSVRARNRPRYLRRIVPFDR